MELSHFDEEGNAIMVDVSAKESTKRTAKAKGSIKVSEEVIKAITTGGNKKGDVINVARIAGIMGVKQTSNIIPLCHPLMINKISIEFWIEGNTIYCEATVQTEGKTGVEMEALTGVSIALLTIYDMCKAIDKNMIIGNTYVSYKEGGKSGIYGQNNGSMYK